MGYVNGEELFDKIAQKYHSSRFSEKEVGGYIQELLYAINYCHSQGIVHRDIKPDNIMVTKNGSIRIIDFGLATFKIKNMNLTTKAGTRSYMAPEVLKGQYGP